MIVSIDDKHLPLRIPHNPPRVVQLPRLTTRCPPGRQGFAIGSKLLDAAIAEFAHVDLILLVDQHAIRIRKLTRLASLLPLLPPGEEKFSLGVEYLEPMIGGVGYPNAI